MNDPAVLIAIVSTLLSALLSTLAISLRDLSRANLQKIAARRGGLARVLPIIEKAAEHALAVSLPRLFFNLIVVGSVLAAFTGIGPGSQVNWPDLVWATIIAASALYIFGVVIPSSVADHAADSVVHRFAPIIRLLYFITLPLARIIRFLDLIIRRLAGVTEMSEEEELENEIRSVLSEGEHDGALDQSEREMIEAVVEFRSTTVDQIMTPRTEMEGFELTDDLDFIKQFIDDAGHSRIPVYEGDLDHIVGILYAKDLLQYLGHDAKSFSLREVLREPHFVPETKPLRGLLADFQQNRVHLFIVLDEYGGTAGLVTIEDVLEEIVGEIEDEYEPITEAAPSIDLAPEDRLVICDARAYIDDVNDTLEQIDAALPEGEGYDTVGGFVLASLGHMPAVGETFQDNGYVVTVLDAEQTRVTRVQIEFRSPAEVEENGVAEPAVEAAPEADSVEEDAAEETTNNATGEAPEAETKRESS